MKIVLVTVVALYILTALFVFGFYSKSFSKWLLYDIGVRTKYAYTSLVTTERYTSSVLTVQNDSSTHLIPPHEFTIASSIEHNLTYEAATVVFDYKLACKPETFGYSMKESELKFPYFGYPRCSDKYKISYDHFAVNITDNSFELRCKDNQTGEYILGNNGPFTFPEINEAKPFLIPLTYPGYPVKFNSSVDYVIARCDTKTEVGFPIAAHFPRINRRRYQETLQFKSLKHKPLIVMMMVLDSFSRRHFYQKLPHTVALFEELNAGDEFAVFDFKLHNVIGDGSTDNTIPIFKDGQIDSDWTYRFSNKLGKEAIWEDFKKHVGTMQGFMTLLLFEGCDMKFPDMIGRVTYPDHLVRHFYCALSSLGTMSTDKKLGTEQRCVGPHMAHVYGFNYIHNFTSLYSGTNQWIYAHFEAGHEASGRHAETIDLDLRDFLQGYIQQHKEEYEIVIMTLADHGMRFGDWFKDIRGYQEHKLPAFFFLASRTYLDSIPEAYSSLSHNSHELMSKKDIRRTLLFLKEYPQTQVNISMDSYGTAYNLLSEQIPDNRTCDDAGIPIWYCSCLSFQEIELGTWNPELQRMLNTIVDVSIQTMNLETYSPVGRYRGYACQKLEAHEILHAYGVQANLHQEILKVVFSVTNSPTASFSATFTLSPYPFGVGKKWEQSMWKYQLPVPVMYRGIKTYLNLILLNRIDKYEGPCEAISVALGLKPDFCFCKHFEEMKLKTRDS